MRRGCGGVSGQLWNCVCVYGAVAGVDNCGRGGCYCGVFVGVECCGGVCKKGL